MVGGIDYNGSDIRWYQNLDGSGLTWLGHSVENDFWYQGNINSADVDGDGDSDIISSNTWNWHVAWWENLSGGFVWEYHMIDDNTGGMKNTCVVDLDNDGDMDVIGSSTNWDELSWWQNLDGTGLAWSKHIIEPFYQQAGDVIASDIDNDGDLDVLCATTWGGHDNEYWWENLGSGLNWEMHVIGTHNGASDIYACDMDGDGDVDILGATNGWLTEHNIYWWEQTGTPPPPDPIEISLFPATEPVIVAAGETFIYDLVIESNLEQPVMGSVWSEAILPNGNTYGPVFSTRFLMTPIMTIIVEGIYQSVPAYAPLGEYSWVINAGMTVNTPIATASFPFTVTAPSADSFGSKIAWQSLGHEQLLSSATSSVIPTVLALLPAHPNPFNTSTTISVTLPELADLTVRVYNVRGQQVAMVASGQFTAGNHNLTFDAAGMASGLYFVRASIPGQMDQVQKIMLVR